MHIDALMDEQAQSARRLKVVVLIGTSIWVLTADPYLGYGEVVRGYLELE